MNTTTSAREILSKGAVPQSTRLATMLEVLLVYAGILLYIWRWQFTHPHAWMLLFAAILSSHLAHRDTLRDLGLLLSGLRANAQLTLSLVVVVYAPLVFYGLARHSLVWTLPGKRALLSFLGYAIWCAFQQYLAQSYFHGRLMRVVQNPHLSSLLVALMFGGAHIPNPLLVVATTFGCFVFSEIFARHRNIWPLALAQAVGGFLIGALTPASLIHNMRVGPGYFFYGHR